jgi:aryl-alcohol dehydrogenase-like predicted oxidoreductase
MTAHVHGWAAFVGLQIEYSLLERSVEQELVPMARELGLGITPWSPLNDCAGLVAGAAWGVLDHHRRAPARAARR